MDIYIGSARIDEHGKAVGGKAGDQKQKDTVDYKGEVSMQKFYDVGKWGYVLRAKEVQVATSIAVAMYRACCNPNVGYNQNQRLQIITYGTNAQKPINCDCSSLVRQCVREAGIEVGNFTTYNEASVLAATGRFDKLDYKAGMKLYLGDILVTKKKGHTVVVVDGYSRGPVEPVTNDIPKPAIEVPKPTLKKGSRNKTEVKKLQACLVKLGISVGSSGIDGIFGKDTHNAVCEFQLEYMSKYDVDGIYGPKTAKRMAELI